MAGIFQRLKQSLRPRRKAATGDRDDTPKSLPRKSFPSGIKPFYSPDNGTVDIVFVHGLTGDRERTWTAQGASEPWPKSLLPSTLPTARTLTFGYDAYVTDWQSVVSQNRIANHAWNLLTSLASYRDIDGTNERPIIFVCHSLGGLVCEDALVISRQRTESHLRNILHSTYGIIFLGTPHHGAGLARWADLLSRSIGLVKQTNPNIVNVLKRDSEVLARIQDSFHTMVKARSTERLPSIEITCFYEELPLAGVGLVVPQHSAILPGYIPIPIHSNHMDMTKFFSTEDPGYVSVCGELRRWVRDADAAKRQHGNPPLSIQSELDEQPAAVAVSQHGDGNHQFSASGAARQTNVQGDYAARDVIKYYGTLHIGPPKEEKEKKCLKVFRLTTAGKDITYEWYKNRVDDRLDGTCKWFLEHGRFKEWVGQESGMLLVTADPGCGKSVLAKYLVDHLIDHGLPRSEAICYFFFKDNDQNTVRQALCAILHQLFSQRGSLIRHAMAEYEKNEDKLKDVTASLWSILEAAGKIPKDES